MVFNEIKYKVIDSTNDEAQRQLQSGMAPREDFVIRADFQTAGRGQRGNSWYSHDAENLTFSYVFFPEKLPVQNQFMLSQAVSTAIVKYLQDLGVEGVSIKWPNDIYVGMKKICGMLIENSVAGHYIKSSIVGVGININQTSFPDNLPNPTSLKLNTGDSYNLDTEFMTLLGHIRTALQSITMGRNPDLMHLYKSHMLGMDTPLRYISGGKVFNGIIRDVDSYGMLQLENEETREVVSYAFNEVNLVIPEH